jgi:hypothetical protein
VLEGRPHKEHWSRLVSFVASFRIGDLPFWAKMAKEKMALLVLSLITTQSNLSLDLIQLGPIFLFF